MIVKEINDLSLYLATSLPSYWEREYIYFMKEAYPTEPLNKTLAFPITYLESNMFLNFSDLGDKDKKFNFAPKIGWRALAEGGPTKTFPNWRRRWDSNPREPFGLRGLATPRNGPAMRRLHESS